jgi:two-component system NarL family sensor kinase
MNALEGHAMNPDLAAESQSAAVVTDDEGRILQGTGTAAELLGLSAAELIGRRIGDLVDESWKGAADGALMRLNGGSLDAFDLMLLGRSGRRSLVRMIPRRSLKSLERSSHFLFWRRLSFSVESGPKIPDAMTRRVAYRLIRRHDDHRARVAVELRHDVASLVTVAKLSIETAAKHLQRGQMQEVASMLFTSSEHLRDTLDRIRRITTELVPSALDDLGLAATIEWLGRQIREAHPAMRVELQLDVEEAFVSSALRLDLYRVIEEALTNAARHSNATRVRIALVATRAEIQLTVEDNGDGFDVVPLLASDATQGGVGLHAIGSRVDASHGSLQFESLPGSGTAIVAKWLIDDTLLNPG